MIFKAFAYNLTEYSGASYGLQASAVGRSEEEAISRVKKSLRTGMQLSELCRPHFPVQIKVWQLVSTHDGIEEKDLKD